MKVAVLGGGGFIGSHVAARHKAMGDEVTVYDIAYPELRRQWWEQADHIYNRDLRLFSFGETDFVYHLAADMGGVGYFHSDADPHAALSNALLDAKVIKRCRETETPFFYASSACAYPTTDQHHGGDYKLDESLLGLGPADQLYGEAKRFGALLCANDPLARVGIIHTIYGPGQEWQGPRTKFPPAICGKVAQGGEIEIWGDGSQIRTMLYIEDAVDKILTVAHDERYDGPVNVGSDEEVSIRECADWLCDHAGIAPDYRFDTSKPVGVAARSADNSRYDATFGRPDTLTAREGLIRLYEWLSSQS